MGPAKSTGAFACGEASPVTAVLRLHGASQMGPRWGHPASGQPYRKSPDRRFAVLLSGQQCWARVTRLIPCLRCNNCGDVQKPRDTEVLPPNWKKERDPETGVCTARA